MNLTDDGIAGAVSKNIRNLLRGRSLKPKIK